MRHLKNVQTLHATVIRVQNYRDSCRIIEVLSEEEGRISLLARGARASKKRFSGGILDLFVSLKMQVQPNDNLWILQSADPVDMRLGIRQGFDLFTRANMLCECARLLAAEGQATPLLWQALNEGLNDLAKGDAVKAMNAYPLLIQAAGLWPEKNPFLFPCNDKQSANRVEQAILAFVEQQTGRTLKSNIAAH